MPVKRDASGRRYVQAEVEVPGTPEEVWRAVATGPGFSAWFVPADVEGRVGGAITFRDTQQPDAGSTGVVTAWEPPRLFAYEDDWPLVGSDTVGRLATEFHVEARAGGTCTVRVVSRLFASGAEWDDQLENTASGWSGYLDILRLYLTHFRGEACSMFYVRGSVAGPQGRSLAAVLEALGISAAAKGKRVDATTAGAPALAGTVEDMDDHRLTLRLDAPAPGIGLLQVYEWAGRAIVTFQARQYGDDAPAAADRYAPAWRAWMEQHFPAQQGVEQPA